MLRLQVICPPWLAEKQKTRMWRAVHSHSPTAAHVTDEAGHLDRQGSLITLDRPIWLRPGRTHSSLRWV